MQHINPQQIGNYIRKWRIIKGFEQKDFADVLDIAKSTLSKWENGHCNLTLVQLEHIANCLKISILQLLKDPNDFLPPPPAMINSK